MFFAIVLTSKKPQINEAFLKQNTNMAENAIYEIRM